MTSKHRIAMEAARPIVYRAIHHGKHEQDRWDAYQWWLQWGDGKTVPKPPKEPKRAK